MIVVTNIWYMVHEQTQERREEEEKKTGRGNIGSGHFTYNV